MGAAELYTQDHWRSTGAGTEAWSRFSRRGLQEEPTLPTP